MSAYDLALADLKQQTKDLTPITKLKFKLDHTEAEAAKLPPFTLNEIIKIRNQMFAQNKTKKNARRL